MFLHNFMYRVKCLLRQKSLVFWTMIFPIALATFFYISLSNIRTLDEFTPIGVALIDNEALSAQPAFRETLEQLAEGENPLFDLTVSDESTALEMLKAYEISGFIKAGVTPEMVVLGSGLNQSILKNFLDQYSQNAAAITEIVSVNPEALPALLESLSMTQNHVIEKGISDKPMNPMVIYFYALIAMACLYGSMYGLEEVNRVQANLSAKAARIRSEERRVGK